VDILLLPLSAGNVSLNRRLNLSRLFPMCAAFPRSEYYKRAPTSTVASVSLRFGHSIDILGPVQQNQDGGGSPRCHDASVSAHAVLFDPAGVSSALATCGRLL
jgi:hypothetical protein